MPPPNLSPLGAAVRRDALILRELQKTQPSQDHTAEVRRLWDSLDNLRNADHQAGVEFSVRQSRSSDSSIVLFQANRLIGHTTRFIAKQRLLVNGLSRQIGAMSQTSAAKEIPSREDWATRSARLSEEIRILDHNVRHLEELKEAIKDVEARDVQLREFYREYAEVWQSWWMEYEVLAMEFEDVMWMAEILADEENL